MPFIDSLINDGWLKTPRIIDAFRKIKREDFLPEDLKALAELNEAVLIGYGQTISQPLVVAFMLELLEPEAGNRILDIGSGSGWTSALLSEIVGDKGKVIAMEIIPELKEFGRVNAEKYGFVSTGRTEFICADGSKGYPEWESRQEFSEGFDRILVSASAEFVPKAWREQLKINGRIVACIENSIWLIVKKSEKDFDEIEHPGFAFVPLISR